MKDQFQMQPMTLTNAFDCDTIVEELNLNQEENEMELSKFYNFSAITLYACINTDIAQSIAAEESSIPLPLNLYESPNIARLITPNSNKKKIVAFAVYVQKNLLDMLSLDDNLEAISSETKNKAWVIRSLEKYTTQNGKIKPYIVYKVQNSQAIRFIANIIL